MKDKRFSIPLKAIKTFLVRCLCIKFALAKDSLGKVASLSENKSTHVPAPKSIRFSFVSIYFSLSFELEITILLSMEEGQRVYIE